MKRIFLAIITLMFVTTISMAQSGITWSAPIPVATNVSGNYYPRITLDAAGNALVLWGHSNRAMFSRWNGTTFSAPIMLNTATVSIASAYWMGPQIASKGDTVYVVMKRIDEAIDTNRLFITHSFNGGATFSPISQFGYIGGNNSRFPTVTIDNTGNPVVGYMKFDSLSGLASWAVFRSNDYGNTFSTDVAASGWTGGSVCNCCPGTIVTSGNTVAMLYRNVLGPIRDMWTGISTDGGTTFTNGFEIDHSNWNLTSCPASGPDGVIIGDSLYSTFMSGAVGTDFVYYSKASISNLNAGAAVQITGDFPGLVIQNFPRIANSGSAVAMAWKQNVYNVDQLGFQFTNNISNGFPPLFDTVAMNNITTVDVAVGQGTVHVVWEDDNAGVVMYRKGTFTPMTTGIHQNIPNGFIVNIYPNPANTFLNIHCSDAQFSTLNSQLIITDILGNEVYKGTLNGLDNAIAVSTWNAGIYFYEIRGETSNIRGKFVKE